MAIEGLDLEALLAPISDDAPCGIDVRNDFSPTSSYFRLRDARAEARASERRAESDPGSEGDAVEYWRNVRALGVKILSEQAKDLEVASWLTEALLRSHGLAGLAFGAGLINGLASRYWEHLYPMPDEDGIETRVAPVTGLNGEGGDGTLSQPLYKLRLFNDGNGEPILYFQYQQSAELEGISDAKRKEARIKAGVMPFDKMESCARATPAGNLVALRRALREAQANWTEMAATLDGLAGSSAPPTRRISEVLDTIGAIINKYAPPEAAAMAVEAEDLVEAAAEGAAGPAAPGAAKRMVTREDALNQLTEIAAFFRRTEPQSPLAYTIEDAIRRGRLSWPELLSELVQDEAVRKNILNSLGIKPA
jgi:type VI secretion system protein ImpA